MPQRLSYRARLLLTIFASASLFLFAGATFWYQDWQYSLPTPRPKGLYQPPLGLRLDLPGEIVNLVSASARRPVFLHFFSPSCPCSKFNLDHIRELVDTFGERVTFLAVLEADDRDKALRAFASLRLGIPAVVDSAVNISGRYGVYSTPQAVILDEDGRLFFRGNYNVSRYCTDPATEYARLALEDLLARRTAPALLAAATIAYGCQLPKHRRGQ